MNEEIKDLDTKEYQLGSIDQAQANEIIELDKEEEVEEKISPEEKQAKKSFFSKLKNKWHELSKKKKIIIFSLIFFLLISLIIFIVFINKKDKEEKKETPKIVLEADNYRYEDGKLIFLDENEKEIGSYDCKNKDQEKCYVAYSSNDNFDVAKYVYEDGTVVLQRMPIYDNTYVFIFDNADKTAGVISLYNLKTKETIEVYKSVKKYDVPEQYIVLENTESNYGLIKIEKATIKNIINFNYDNLGIIIENKIEYNVLVALKDAKYYLIDYSGKELSKGLKNEIRDYNNNYIKVIDSENKYNIYDYNGKKLLNSNYDYITLLNNYALVINNQSLSVIDYAENKMNYDSLALGNTDYIRSYVFDKNKNLKTTKYAYEAEQKDDLVTITYLTANGEESKTINCLEGSVNINYSYISYYDGVLYFFSDAKKTQLVGSYECQNKNVITSKNSKLDYCYLAKESYLAENEMSRNDNILGYLPIVNKRFVFVEDTIDPTSDKAHNIVLYDLLNQKTLSSYSVVDAGIYSGADELTYLNDIGLLVIGKSTKKEKYGIIKLEGTKASPVLDFNYNNLERMAEYFLANKSSGTYLLLNSNGEAITSEFSNKIVAYHSNYLKVKAQNKYLAYNFKGEPLTSKNFDYLKLNDNYWSGVSDNKLYLYNYSNSSALNTVDISLYLTDYEKAFNITYNNSEYTVKVFKADGTYDTVVVNS